MFAEYWSMRSEYDLRWGVQRHRRRSGRHEPAPRTRTRTPNPNPNPEHEPQTRSRSRTLSRQNGHLTLHKETSSLLRLTLDPRIQARPAAPSFRLQMQAAAEYTLPSP